MLIAYYDDVLDWEFAVIVVLVYPLIQVVEALLVRNIEDEDAAVSPSIVAGCKRSKSLLTCSVPDLEPNPNSFLAIIVEERSRTTVNSNCRIIICYCFILSDSHQHRCLARVLISNDYHFEILIVAFP